MEKTEKQETIERLKADVEYAEANNYDMDDRSWGYEQGTLISYNEAKAIIQALQEPVSPQKGEELAKAIIKKHIPHGIVNIKGKGDGKPQKRAEDDVIIKCMEEYAQSKQEWESKWVPYQKCPVCEGSGVVWNPHAMSTAPSQICSVCNGAKIIPQYVITQPSLT